MICNLDQQILNDCNYGVSYYIDLKYNYLFIKV